jgi:hypothetical protein
MMMWWRDDDVMMMWWRLQVEISEASTAMAELQLELKSTKQALETAQAQLGHHGKEARPFASVMH